MRELEKKRILITGGAQGIGLALGCRFAAEGAEVVVTDLNEEALPAAEEAIVEAGGEARTFAMDVTDAASIASVRQRLHREAGPIDVLVNNAGVVFGGSFLDTSLDKHRLTYDVNLFGVVAVTHAFLPELIERPEAHLVQIASASGFIGLPYGATYASSKWGVIGFSESIRLELDQLGHSHVGVTTVCPSYVNTGLFEGARPPLATSMVTPERVGELTVRAVRRNEPFVLTPWLVNITPATRALLPTRWFDRVAWVLGVTSSMKDWRGHQASAGKERRKRAG